MRLFDNTYMKVPLKVDPELHDLLIRQDNRSALIRQALDEFFQKGLTPLQVKDILARKPELYFTHKMGFTLPRKTVQKVETYCFKSGGLLSRSEVIRFALRLHFSLYKELE